METTVAGTFIMRIARTFLQKVEMHGYQSWPLWSITMRIASTLFTVVLNVWLKLWPWWSINIWSLRFHGNNISTLLNRSPFKPSRVSFIH